MNKKRKKHLIISNNPRLNRTVDYVEEEDDEDEDP